ncbi:putative mitochondrial protein AtMg00310 [Silene latifolia]|uniref:putative mitochondrial protein AtMg00310 n=1 Tax=Silene latifolia TaxID=37657 RepID=UPI003D78135F
MCPQRRLWVLIWVLLQKLVFQIVENQKKDIFNCFIDNIQKRVSSWNGILLSPAGRLTLISSILSSLSTYFLSVFKIPVSVTRKIDSLLSQFWWKGNRKSGGIHWCSKLFLSQPKGLGIGVRNVSCFNQALLAKVGWNILRKENSLLTRTIGSKYKLISENCGATFSHKRANSTWIGKGVLWGISLFARDLAWQAGSSSEYSVWNFNWMNGVKSFPRSDNLLDTNPSLLNLKVKNLINGDGSWNIDVIYNFFCGE